jgi:hypothetical protein
VTLHPWGSLNSNSTSKIGMLKDGTLSSVECLRCYDAILQVCENSSDSKALDPELFFKPQFLDRKDVLGFEAELRSFMETLAVGDARKFQGIVEKLGKDVKEELSDVVIDSKYLDDKIYDVVMDLKNQRMLPAIMVFLAIYLMLSFRLIVTHVRSTHRSSLRNLFLSRPHTVRMIRSTRRRRRKLLLNWRNRSRRRMQGKRKRRRTTKRMKERMGMR